MRKIAWVYHTPRWAAKRLALAVMLTASICGAGSAFAQTFNSGSTGVDGAFNPTCTPTPCTVTVPLPATGIFNFTTINIPAGVTVKFTRNATNTPVTMLASGNVTIAGTIDLNGGAGASGSSGTTIGPNGGIGGPGGFDGGDGGDGIITTGGGAGLGPGGGGGGVNGIASGSGAGGGFALAGSSVGGGGPAGGAAYGTPSLLPLIGGSGGGGGAAQFFGTTGAGGGGGGGALLIASSGTMTFTGTVAVSGGNGGGMNYGYPGGGGSGGAIRLVATTITGSGGFIRAYGGSGGAGGAATSGSVGRIRIEAFTSTATINLTQTSSIAQPGVLALPNAPGLVITSVAGSLAPTSPTGSFSAPDITLPASTANPMTITLAASHIPLGTTVTVTARPLDGSATTATSSPLAGTLEASTATASLTIPTNQPSVISASATFTLAALPGANPVFADGEKVELIRVAAILGGHSQVAYITASGRELPADTLLGRPLIDVVRH